MYHKPDTTPATLRKVLLVLIIAFTAFASYKAYKNAEGLRSPTESAPPPAAR